MDSKPLWTEEQLIAKAEGVAAHWRHSVGSSNVYDLSRDILHLLRQQKDEHQQRLREVEAERDAATTRIAELLDDCIGYAISYGIGDEDGYRAEYRELTGKEWGENE